MLISGWAKTSRWVGTWGLGALSLVAALGLAGCDQPKDASPLTKGGPLETRRITEQQYREIIADVFGPTITIPGRFEPDIRENGLLAVGTGHVSVTESGLEQYDITARGIASQVLDETRRKTLVPCKPAKPNEADDACASQFLSKTGRLLFRRPLTKEELATYVKSAADGTKTLGNFYSGLELSLAGMLVSPQFLFRQEAAVADSGNPAERHLDAYSKASRISFFLWNTAPDTELLDAAAKGELDSKAGIARQVDRMLNSPRLENGVRAFFSDMLGFDQFNALAKDPLIYPKYSFQVARDAQEQTLRTISDLLINQKGDYRDIFTTRKTFLTRVLGSIYQVPVAAQEGWEEHEYAPGDPRAGILSQISFVALHSHPGRSSATLRGKAVREILLCQKVPDPPGNVNFSVVQDTSNPQFKTARARLGAHVNEPMCAGCHKIIDPIGLAMENFDSAGGFRTTENDAPIVTSGELDGTKFEDVTGFAKAIHDHPQATSCLVNRLYAYAAGRPSNKGEAEWSAYMQKQFAADGYRVPDLMRQIATSDAFYRIAAPGAEAGDFKLSSAGR